MTTAVTPAAAQEEDLLLEHQLRFALTVAARSVVGAYKPVLEKLHLTHPQYLVMLCLWENSRGRCGTSVKHWRRTRPPSHPSCAGWRPLGLITRGRANGNECALAVDLTA